MDLLGDLGSADQLTSARAENKVLQAKVKELSEKVNELQVENQTLLAEVEIYRAEASAPESSLRRQSKTNNEVANGGSDSSVYGEEKVEDAFILSGNGTFPSDPVVSLANLHGQANPLCCALHPNGTILATGGASNDLTLCEWGSALKPAAGAADQVVSEAARLSLEAPVICIGFAQTKCLSNLVAVGCMDGSVSFAGFGRGVDALSSDQDNKLGLQLLVSRDASAIKHGKYIKCIEWSPTEPILATASADGTVQLFRVGIPQNSNDEFKKLSLELKQLQTLHLSAAVESMCFLDSQTLCVFVRGTPFLSCFDLSDGFKQTKMNLNKATMGGFEEHVSFAVMQLVPSPNGKYLAAATDASRNIILDVKTGKQIRNLYGHQNDGYSIPKIAWSSSGQYLFGNTQDDSSICVWDIASSQIVKRLGGKGDNGGHLGQIRDMVSCPRSDTLITTSYDKTTKIWLTA